MQLIAIRSAVILIAFAATAASGDTAGGLIAQWPLDEGRGNTAADGSGNRRDATLHGATWVKQGGGHALAFDGVDDYVDCGDVAAMNFGGPITVEMWFKPTRKAKGLSAIVGLGLRTFLLAYYNTELCIWYVGHHDKPNSVSTQLTLDRWHHIAATFDGERMALWLNGRLAAGRESTVTGFTVSAGRLTIGAKGRADLPRFAGLIDNVRIYSRALTDAEIAAHVQDEGEDYGLAVGAVNAVTGDEAIAFFQSHPNPVDVKQHGNSILLANDQIGLEIQQTPGGFQLARVYSMADRHEFMNTGKTVGLRDLFEIVMVLDPKHQHRDERWNTKMGLMGIIDEMAEGSFPIGSHDAEQVSWRSEAGEGETTLRLEWKRMNVRESKGAVDVTVTVRLRAGDPLSYWRIAVQNRSTRYGIERVRFPIVSIAPIGDASDDVFIYPIERGGLVKDPFNAPTGLGHGFNTKGAYYPVDFNMQFQAIYDEAGGAGIYLGTHDPTPNLMNMQIINTPEQITWRPGHFPPNITFSEEAYTQPYDCVVGPFHGDWYDAAQRYRTWAHQQSWSAKGPLRDRQDVPRWYAEAPLYFYTTIGDSAQGTFDRDKNMRIAIDHFEEFLKWADMKLPANWYSWRDYKPGLTTVNVPFNGWRLNDQGRWRGLVGNTYHVGNYPQIGALPSFTEQSKRAKAMGGMNCPYVPLELFDQGPDENAPHAAAARPNITRDLYGSKRTWGGLHTWQPCAWTTWWRNRLRETAEQLIEREHIGGIYLDVMQGSALPCYWTPHGHTAAGADVSTTGMHELVEIIYNAVKTKDPEVIITGENSTENMIDVIDGILQLTLGEANKVPMFAVVYQDYIKRYGLEMSTGAGWQNRYASSFDKNAFFIEAASMFVEGMQIGRIRLRPRDASLSLTEPGQKPMVDFLEDVLDYHRQTTARRFLAYGRLLRPLSFEQPSPMPMLKYKRGGEFSALMSGVFADADGELAVFVVNASSDELEFAGTLPLAAYGLKSKAVNVDRITPAGDSTRVHRGAKNSVSLQGVIPGRGIVMYHIRDL